MQSRELMKDAPELDVLLSRCISTPYNVDAFDFFYMQGLSERDKLRFPKFNPADGHWYGASVCVAGGYCQRKLKEGGYSSEVLDANKKLIKICIQHEIECGKGNLQRRQVNYNKISGLFKRLRKTEHPVKDFLSSATKEWRSCAEEFRKLYKELSGDVYINVNFSSPVFANTKLFLPFKEKRKPSDKEIDRLSFISSHEIYPFTAHLTYHFIS